MPPIGPLRLIGAITGAILLLVAAFLLIGATDPRRWAWFALSVLAGLALAGAAAAWRRSWQRGRQHRQRWGTAAWLAFWIGIIAIALAVVGVSAPVTTIVPTVLGAAVLGMVVTPRARSPVMPPRFTEGWQPLPMSDGRAAIDDASLAVPSGWTAWRVPDVHSTDGFGRVPPDRRWDLPMPMVGGGRMSAADAAEAGSPEQMADQLLAQIPGNAPIVLQNVRRGSAFVGGESAFTLDFEARLRPDRLPAPRIAVSLGSWIVGGGPIAGRVYVVDRAGVRWLIGWIGWADGRSSLEPTAEGAIRSWRWTAAHG